MGSLNRHIAYECGKEPQFKCIVESCNYRGKRKEYWKCHIISRHPELVNQIMEKITP